MFLMWSALRICNFCLLYCWSYFVLFSLRIFRNSVVGQAIELVSERCIVKHLD